MRKKVFRSQTDKMMAGVCGGLAEYFNVDSAVVRLAFVTVSLLTCLVSGLLVYLAALLLIPKDQEIVA